MLAVYLFNLTGYNFLFRYYIHQSDQVISKQADENNFSADALTEIKIQLNLPYLTNWADFERYDGEIEIDGKHYNYVKRKVSNDTLYLLCLPNEAKTQLYKTKIAFGVTANDLPAEKDGKSHFSKKEVSAESGKIQWLQFDYLSFDKKIATTFNSLSSIPDIYLTYAGQPPEFTC